MTRTTQIMLVAGIGVVGYLLYQRYRDWQRAQAHPIVLPSDASLIRPVPVDVSLVSDAQVISS